MKYTSSVYYTDDVYITFHYYRPVIAYSSTLAFHCGYKLMTSSRDIYTSTLQLYNYSQYAMPCVFRWEQLQKKFQDTLQNMIAGELGSPLIARYPFLVPAYLSQGFKVIKGANPTEPKLEQLPYAIHFLYGLKYTTAYDMEFAFPVDIDKPDGFDVLLKAVHIAVEAVADAAKPGEAWQLSHLSVARESLMRMRIPIAARIYREAGSCVRVKL